MAYIGVILFALMFYVITSNTSGSMGQRMDETFAWLHAWAPFSYLLILIVLVAPVVSMKIVMSWPKQQEPEDPMAKYRHNTDDVMED